MDREAWGATVHGGHKESDVTEVTEHLHVSHLSKAITGKESPSTVMDWPQSFQQKCDCKTRVINEWVERVTFWCAGQRWPG